MTYDSMDIETEREEDRWRGADTSRSKVARQEIVGNFSKKVKQKNERNEIKDLEYSAQRKQNYIERREQQIIQTILRILEEAREWKKRMQGFDVGKLMKTSFSVSKGKKKFQKSTPKRNYYH